ncbi:helix-turn-helix transcriptional regulator [Bittarella massiliensis]|nr:helix-turn-helix domain-containing protein [Bittarella massiliensis (ex Durand et al. 2017)]MBO1680676.1 helix-turn-helix transcriptional regulator [Bittarella massiliensis (ex Durand et al. 2017)]
MNADFHRILTLLRKEKGVSQKQVAASLGISQALLSHYEKGIRECGLEFVVKVADYYGVSCDYLLGRSPDRAGLTLSVDDLPDGDGGRQNAFAGSIMPVLNKKLITNSLHIVFDMLSKGRNDSLTREVSGYLMTAVYKSFRKLCGINPKNQDTMFSISKVRVSHLCGSAMSQNEANIDCLSAGQDLEGLTPIENRDAFALTTQSMTENYPLYYSSLQNLISNVEAELGKNSGGRGKK